MPNNRPDDSYDLQGASALSARLARADAQPSPQSPSSKSSSKTPKSAPAFVRFSAARFSPKAPEPAVKRGPLPPPPGRAAEAPAPPPALSWEEGMRGPIGWSLLLQRCREVIELRGAFVVDPQGLLIASHGSVPGEGPESVGARLAIAFEQADHMGAPGTASHSLAIELGDCWLTGLRITVAEEPRMVVGLCGERSLDKSELHALSKVFVRKAAGA